MNPNFISASSYKEFVDKVKSCLVEDKGYAFVKAVGETVVFKDYEGNERVFVWIQN